MFPPFISDIRTRARLRASYGRGLSVLSSGSLLPRPPEQSAFPLSLDRALNLTRTQASGADVNMLRRTVYKSLDTLDIRFEGAVGADVRVRHGDAKGYALAAKLALCHDDTSYLVGFHCFLHV